MKTKNFRVYKKSEFGGESNWLNSYETRKEAEYAANKRNEAEQTEVYFVVQIHEI